MNNKKFISRIHLRRMIEQKDMKTCNICKKKCYSFQIVKFRRLSDSPESKERWVPHLFFICLKCENYRKSHIFYKHLDRQGFIFHKLAKKDYDKEMKEGEMNFILYNKDNKIKEIKL